MQEKHIKLDFKDRKILMELDMDARQSASSIAKKVRLSKDVVNYRIKRMESLGIIKGYYTVLDVSKLGYYNFRVFLKFYNVTPEKEAEIISYLHNHPRVGWLVSVDTHWDANMLVWAENMYVFRRFWNDFLKLYKNYLEEKWISIITEMVLFTRGFMLEEGEKYQPNKQVVGGSEEVADIDDADYRILNVIASNARTPIIEIAEKTKLSAKVVEYRIKKMVEKKVILGFKLLPNLDLLGVSYYKVHLTLHNMTGAKERELMTYAEMHPNIYIVDVTVGGADFEIELLVKNIQQFRGIVDDIKRRFAGIIRNIESFNYYKEYKWVYIPVDVKRS
ncbi:Lrp/AsnC family transcriptional regulator [Candidatus Woesearchaeota archaeon]|nr:Lrp/AsnC family transcriptional regulator [Candidatus Woesearchaeota archaeon]